MTREDVYDGFTNNGYLEKNLDALHEKLVEDDNEDLWILIIGPPGKGKTALAVQMGLYLKQGGFNEHNLVFTHDQWMEETRSGKKNKYIDYQEGYNTFYRRNAMTKENKQGKETAMQYRFKNHVQCIEFQSLGDFEPDVFYNRVHVVIRVVKKGWAWFYSQKKFRKIDLDARRIKWPTPDFRFSFPNPDDVFPEFWTRCEEYNEEALRDDADDDGQDEFENGNWLSVGEFAERLGIHENTVRNWCDDGKLKHGRLSSNGDRRIPESEVGRMIEDPVKPDAKDKGEKPDAKHA